MKDLAALLPILQARLDGAGAELAALRAAEDRLAGQIATLRQDRNTPRDPESLAVRMGSDLRWRLWADQRLADLETERARLRADALRAEAAARAAFTKLTGLSHLIALRKKQERQRAARRADYAS